MGGGVIIFEKIETETYLDQVYNFFWNIMDYAPYILEVESVVHVNFDSDMPQYITVTEEEI